MLHRAARPAAVPVDAGDRLRDGRRQRGELPLPQPLLRGQPARRRVRELDAIERRYQGIPWVNTIAADSTGEAYYADIGTVPHVTDEEIAALQHDRARRRRRSRRCGLPVLDGSRAACGGATTRTRSRPGSSARRGMPSLFRDDYVTNSNDSYWLVEPGAAAGGLRPDHRRRAHRAHAAHPHRPADRRRPARARAVHAAGAAGHRLQQPPVRGRADARRPGRAVPQPATSAEAVRRARRLGPARRTSTRRARVLFRRFVTRAARRPARSPPPGIWRDAVRRRRPGQHAARLNTDNPR